MSRCLSLQCTSNLCSVIAFSLLMYASISQSTVRAQLANGVAHSQWQCVQVPPTVKCIFKLQCHLACEISLTSNSHHYSVCHLTSPQYVLAIWYILLFLTLQLAHKGISVKPDTLAEMLNNRQSSRKPITHYWSLSLCSSQVQAGGRVFIR